MLAILEVIAIADGKREVGRVCIPWLMHLFRGSMSNGGRRRLGFAGQAGPDGEVGTMVAGQSENGCARGQANPKGLVDEPAQVERARMKAGQYTLEETALTIPAGSGRGRDLASIQPTGEDALRDQIRTQATTIARVKASAQIRRTFRQQMPVRPDIRLQTARPTVYPQIRQDGQTIRLFLQATGNFKRDDQSIAQGREPAGPNRRIKQARLLENPDRDLVALLTQP